jgi:hypothetical protein
LNIVDDLDAATRDGMAVRVTSDDPDFYHSEQAVSTYVDTDSTFEDYFKGDFTPGDQLLESFFAGPMTLAFASPVSAFGTQIQSAEYGDFTATFQAYDAAGHLLIAFSDTGNSGLRTDNSAMFFGVSSSAANISKVVLDTPDNGLHDFIINRVDFGGPIPTVPEPGGLALFLPAWAAYGWVRRRRKTRA